MLHHETRAKARASIGEAPQEGAIWAEGASQLARSRVTPAALRQPLSDFFRLERRTEAATLEKGPKRHDSWTMATAPKATTTDALYDGAVSLRQPARGYRVNVDALLLAAFAAQGRQA